jgi:hypothetical protein
MQYPCFLLIIITIQLNYGQAYQVKLSSAYFCPLSTNHWSLLPQFNYLNDSDKNGGKKPAHKQFDYEIGEGEGDENADMKCDPKPNARRHGGNRFTLRERPQSETPSAPPIFSRASEPFL